jgi:signal transduction histidine kinase
MMAFYTIMKRLQWLACRGLKLRKRRRIVAFDRLIQRCQITLLYHHLSQIISNLVSNSLKYTEKGCVTITANASTESPNCVTVEVSDTGIGIEEKYLEKIFLPYVRLENAKRLCSDGSGLGLSIVERLTASIGGSLQVESQVGQGTRFRITVPGLVTQSAH